jgi:hypothetical protein
VSLESPQLLQISPPTSPSAEHLGDGMQSADISLDEVNREFDTSRARSRLIDILVFLVFLGITLALGVRPVVSLSQGNPNAFSLVVAAAFWGFLIWMGVTNVGAYQAHKPGANRLRLSSEELRVEFPGGDVLSLRWNDPLARAELTDVSTISPGHQLKTPYMLIIGGRGSFLTLGAYQATMEAARKWGRLGEGRLGPRYILLSSARPTIWPISGRA